MDDGSTDGSGAILQGYAAADARVRLHAHCGNLGLVRALQTGLDLCRAPLVARMDADDVALPNRLQEQVDFMRAHPHIGVLGTAVEVFRTPQPQKQQQQQRDDVAATVAATSASASATVTAQAGTAAVAADSSSSSSSSFSCPSPSSRVLTQPCLPGLVAWSLSFFCPLAHPSVMFRVEEVLRRGVGVGVGGGGGGGGAEGAGYRAGWRDAEDLELWQRLSRAGTRMANLPKVLLRLRKHGGNVSSSTPAASAASPSAASAAAASAPSDPASAAPTSPAASASAAPPFLRSSPLQKFHAVLASSLHMSLLLGVGVGPDMALGLMHPCPATLPTVAHVAAASALLQALETAALPATFAPAANAAANTTLSEQEQQAIRSDCTARMGELVTLAMQIEASSAFASASAAASTAVPLSPFALLQQTAADAVAARASSSSSSSPSASCASSASTAAATVACSFFTPTPAGATAASLMRTWMSRGAGSAALLAKLLAQP